MHRDDTHDREADACMIGTAVSHFITSCFAEKSVFTCAALLRISCIHQRAEGTWSARCPFLFARIYAVLLSQFVTFAKGVARSSPFFSRFVPLVGFAESLCFMVQSHNLQKSANMSIELAINDGDTPFLLATVHAQVPQVITEFHRVVIIPTDWPINRKNTKVGWIAHKNVEHTICSRDH